MLKPDGQCTRTLHSMSHINERQITWKLTTERRSHRLLHHYAHQHSIFSNEVDDIYHNTCPSCVDCDVIGTPRRKTLSTTTHKTAYTIVHYLHYCIVYKHLRFNPFRSYIGPRSRVWFSSSAPDVGRRPTRFLLRLFARCRSLSDVFPHAVRTLANR
jgi:hypothetical protein